MRHLSAITVEASMTGTVPDVSSLPGVGGVSVDGRVLRCQVHGSIQPLLRALADAGAARLLSHEPSLEELFLTLYGEHDHDGGAPG